MQTIQLPDTTPEPGPERVALAALARRGPCSPALTRIVPQHVGERAQDQGAAGAFQSCV